MGVSRRSKKKVPTAEHTPLAHEQYSELNATFYTGDPAEFLATRIEALSLMLLDNAELTDVMATARQLGILTLGGITPPRLEARLSYVQVEAVMIFHHASETVLRMFIAHVDYEECPWRGIASSRTPLEFKEKCIQIREGSFKEEDVARVFMGGADANEASLDLTDDEFEESVAAISDLLRFCASRILDEAFVYNAAKHGLSTVNLDESTRIGMENSEGQMHSMSSGRMLTYLHKPAYPGACGGPEWFVSTTGTLPDQDIGVAVVIQRAVSSLWDVAKRKYTGVAGSITVFTADSVKNVINAPILASLNHVRTVTFELPKKQPDDTIAGVEISIKPQILDEGWNSDSPGLQPTGMTRIDLPLRPGRDRVNLSEGVRHLLPFSPRGSAVV